MKTIRVLAAGVLMLAIAACNTTKVDNAIASTDLKFRDKCDYAISGLEFARLGAAIFVPSASALVAEGSAAVRDYCEGAPVTDVVSAMRTLEKFIVAVRPIAAQVQK